MLYILCDYIKLTYIFSRLVYSDLDAVAPLDVEKMPYALQSVTLGVS